MYAVILATHIINCIVCEDVSVQCLNYYYSALEIWINISFFHYDMKFWVLMWPCSLHVSHRMKAQHLWVWLWRGQTAAISCFKLSITEMCSCGFLFSFSSYVCNSVRASTAVIICICIVPQKKKTVNWDGYCRENICHY